MPEHFYHIKGQREDYYANRLFPYRNWPRRREVIMGAIQDEWSLYNTGEKEALYYIFSSAEDFKELHEKYSKRGAFMSEIIADQGIRAAQGLANLAPLIRLEKEGANLDLLQNHFNSLWLRFSQRTFKSKQDTHNNRSRILYALLSTNVLDLIEGKAWENYMRNYFREGTTAGWNKRKMINQFRLINKGLDPNFEPRPEDDKWLHGVVNFDMLKTKEEFEKYCFPKKDFQKIPYHTIIFQARNLETSSRKFGLNRRFSFQIPSINDYIRILCNRTSIISRMVPEKDYSRTAIIKLAILPEEAVMNAIGVSIASGLMLFKKGIDLDWNHPDQYYRLSDNGISMKNKIHLLEKQKAFDLSKPFRQLWGKLRSTKENKN